MNSNLLMDFSVDKKSNHITVKREFAAPVNKVWAAWTQPEILDQWWAPKPWKAETKTMDFREGGFWLYAMVGPKGEKHWARADYLTVVPQQNYTAKDSFCDENGITNTSMPGMMWNTSFRQEDGNTIVTVEIQFDKLEDLEATIQMGFKEGFLSAMDNLDEIFAKQ